MTNIDSPLPNSVPASEEANSLTVSGAFDPACPTTQLRMQDGHVIQIPTSVLLYRDDVGQNANYEDGRRSADSESSYTIPIIEEQLTVGKRTVSTARILLHKTVQEYQETLDEPLAVRTFDIERVVLNQVVDAAPAVRTEGDTTVYPLVEEQLVLTKQLVLKEEVRVTRRDTERRDHQVVTLHREHLVVERQPVENPGE